MTCLKPKHLQKGDTVGVIAPASPPNLENLERGIQFLIGLGLNVKKGKSVEKINGYLAGTDLERLDDLHGMFLDKEVKAIICACGGYGTGRIAANIDYEIIRNNPKILWGYSDITFLHTAIRQETGLVTFHGPMLGSDIGKVDTHPLSKERFLQLFSPAKLTYTEEISPLEVLVEGDVSGPLIGGNLSLLVSSLGTRFEVDTKEKLLLIEDVNEEPRAIDRMLNQLYMSGKLEEASGILIGDFCDCLPKRDLSLTLDEIIDYYVKLANKPAIKGLQIGHCNPHIAVPFGVQATLNTTEKRLIVDSGIK
ncbi:S66 peptidase family protein [Neobacillus kokaensis]|uniref:Murein peptide carboxypeptidase n=1 Tax=Neobacillus kokaensis TaxID=2759023 RepID=A0ABQ3MZS3_9BACI|nr:LD-carboxypeptidase [Neobacillus kokaensis]GHH96753.1 putative murein peptide carboxypeptidase [Neobacillus kokaensis]